MNSSFIYSHIIHCCIFRLTIKENRFIQLDCFIDWSSMAVVYILGVGGGVNQTFQGLHF